MTMLRENHKAYLTYEDEPLSRALLLKETQRTGYLIYKDGKCLNSKKKGEYILQHFSVAAIEDMQKVDGVVVERQDDIVYGKKNKTFGIETASANRIKSENAVRVRIAADTPAKLFEKVDFIMTEMKSKGYTKEPKACYWSNTLPFAQ